MLVGLEWARNKTMTLISTREQSKPLGAITEWANLTFCGEHHDKTDRRPRITVSSREGLTNVTRDVHSKRKITLSTDKSCIVIKVGSYNFYLYVE
ncbi:hypothetical protein JCM1840_003355 [Sporobolomyces johnsonii]